MIARAIRRGIAFLLTLLPLPVLAQGLNIDHKPVGCIVAEKYPKMNACFSPASQMARARVYFRAADGPPNWYYVEMKSEAPCHAGILPKPKKALIGKKVLYYVNAFDQKFAENRTVDNAALVVGSESECKKDVPVAPFVTSASVTVFPAVPAGFATGGIGTATVVAAVAGGAAIVGGGIALGTSGNSNTTTTTQPAGSSVPTVPATTPGTTPPTTPAAVPFNPVFIVRVAGVTIPSDAQQWLLPGTQQVEFDMCQSTGPTKLHYNVDVAAGARFAFPPTPPPPPPPAVLGGPCSIKVTFNFLNITTPFAGITGPSASPGMAGARPVSQLTSSSSRRRPRSTSDGVRPVFTLIPPPPASPCPVPASLKQRRPRSMYDLVRPAFTLIKPLQCWNVRMRVESSGVGNDPKAHRDIVIAADPTISTSNTDQLVWTSKLEVPGASGEVLVNSSATAFAGPGLSAGMAYGHRGENRFEARVLQGAGKPGTWRFELGSTANFVPGSLRVLAGSVTEVSGDALVFRLSGRPGERVMFTFRTSNY
ncbi:MAG TPA: hypothetical protein VN461_12300 [Vicinamibacteria bacterium]|jgi:hypothetical protein|nr:hypothetical protein [Vicinamibacteria bacterium]